MIHILGDSNDRVATEIVRSAFERSFTRGQVHEIDSYRQMPAGDAIVVALSPPDDALAPLLRLVESRAKVVLLGSLNGPLCKIAGVTTAAVPPALADTADCEAAPARQMRVSRAAIDYSDVKLGRTSPLRRRHCCRFDFLNEWNNLGYGRVRFGRDRWSIAELASSYETAIATVVIDGGLSAGAAVTLRELTGGSVLWFARPVGPVDGQDWAVIENFISSHRADVLPCRPHLRGIPHGIGAAVTMRLDCDEDIASARPLLDLYRGRNHPISLAIATGQPDKSENLALIRDVLEAGGAVLSHSVTHAPRWGGSGEAAEREARQSKSDLEARVHGLDVRHAVSPFHQNPSYVPEALSRAGYAGFIGGSIASDPEFLMARAGIPPFGPPTIVSHSQSCMLHGDCMLDEGDPLLIYKQAFLLARDGSEFFGYLDHPFSARYAYGWRDEDTRLAAHAAYLDFLDANSGAGPLLFVNEDICLRFIAAKAACVIEYDALSEDFTISKTEAAGLPISIGYRDDILEAQA